MVPYQWYDAWRIANMPMHDSPLQTVLETLDSVLRRVSNCTMPPALDRRMLDLGERKEMLTPEERDELMAWVAFSQELSVEKSAADVVLDQLEQLSR
jgi:hypothetical protein